MAKPVLNNKKSKYMKQQEEKFGPNFMAVKNPKDMYKDMPRIIAEFVNYNIDINTYGYIFLTTQFLQAAESYCIDQMNLLAVLNRNYDAFIRLNNGMVSEYDVNLIQTIQQKYQAYELIYKTLILVKNTCSYEPMRRLQVELNKQYRGVLQRGTVI